MKTLTDFERRERVIVLSPDPEEGIYIRGKLVGSGYTVSAEAILNLCEDAGIARGEYFIVVVGIPGEFELPEVLTDEDLSVFGLDPEYDRDRRVMANEEVD
jgi:hypothetical protein